MVGEVLREARAGLFGEVERSRALSTVHGNTLGFVVGAIAGAVSNLTGPTSSVLTGAAGGVLGLLLHAATERGDGVPAFLRRHYVVFDRAGS